MIDHLLGRPSTAYRRSQVLLVILFWTLAILRGNKNGPPIVRWFSSRIKGKLTPWQVLAATLTCLYTVKNADSLLGLQAPEPLAKLYSRDFYRATWMAVALDTGFATAMHVRPKWLRDILSMLFSGYYLFFAHEADEKLRKYRAVCTVEFLRTTWEKTNNPFIRLITFHTRPRLGIKRRIVLPRPSGSPYSRPVVGWLYFDGSESDLALCRNLILDIPGGGFVCMDPTHHDERLHYWAKRKGCAVLSLDYSKAPEYPYPYAVHECFDVYRLLHDTRGSVIGTRAGELRIVLTGDSAGANIGAAMVIKLLEMPATTRLSMPVSIIWTYPCLDFNFTSFMPPEHLRILRQESSSGLRSIAEQKDHLKHQSPLSVVEDNVPRHKRRKSWSKSFSKLPLLGSSKSPLGTPHSAANKKLYQATAPPTPMTPAFELSTSLGPMAHDDGDEADVDSEGEGEPLQGKEMTLSDRVQYWNPDRDYAELGTEEHASSATKKQSRVSALGTRLTMTSRTGFFNDRIISPSMMRAMAICYVGPRNSPDLSKNYYISPILTPDKLLAQFPPVYLLCGERDPFSDDTLIFSGRLRDAKLAKKAEVQAKYNKHGEGLRMSSAKDSTRDPILDETEEDWVTMRFIEGWSHGFMQMATLLPKVTHFFDLTADWAALSFAKQETSSYAPSIQANAMDRVPTHGESQSEKEEEVLSFVPRRRGSNRSNSPALSPGLRAQWQQQQQEENGQSSSSAQLSSASTGSDGMTSGTTPPTSISSSASSKDRRARRPSPGESVATKGGPIRRVLQEEADSTGQSLVAQKRASSFGEESSSYTIDGSTATIPARRSSDVTENKVAAAAFVEAQDILKRRREDAVVGLGSAVLSSDSDTEQGVAGAGQQS